MARWKLAVAGALCGVAAALAFRFLLHGGLVDDAFITLRVARNLARGLGPVFNPGERLEVTTSPLWTTLLALGLRFGAPGILLSDLLSLTACGAAGAGVALLAGSPRAAALALFALALSPGYQGWALTGMEVPLAGAVLVFAALAARRGRPVAAGLLGALLTLARPEFLPAALAVCLAAFWRGRPLHPSARSAPGAVSNSPGETGGRGGKRLAWSLAALVAPVAAHLLVRHWYFGTWVPNTYVAKAGGADLAMHLRGVGYVGSAALFHLPLCAGFFAGPLFALPVAAAALSVAWLGGDHFALGRLMMPAAPLLAAGAGAFLARLRAPPLRAAASSLLVLLALGEVAFARSAGKFADLEPEWSQAGFGEMVSEALQPLPGSLASVTIGALGWYGDRPMLDLVGLADAHIARTPHLSGVASGHDHADVDYTLERAPDLILPLSFSLDVPWELWMYEATFERFRAHFRAGELLYLDPRFRARYHARQFRLRDGRYVLVWQRNR